MFCACDLKCIPCTSSACRPSTCQMVLRVSPPLLMSKKTLGRRACGRVCVGEQLEGSPRAQPALEEQSSRSARHSERSSHDQSIETRVLSGSFTINGI